mmetsp:Transcript_21202/g.39418  ORF Transcript_21202/g.39418 Transcript_21202/m.39418 type:complete len:148 (-) Transcript_21202:284-727(-)
MIGAGISVTHASEVLFPENRCSLIPQLSRLMLSHSIVLILLVSILDGKGQNKVKARNTHIKYYVNYTLPEAMRAFIVSTMFFIRCRAAWSLPEQFAELYGGSMTIPSSVTMSFPLHRSLYVLLSVSNSFCASGVTPFPRFRSSCSAF